jgi:hypothetical protein
VDLPRLPWCMAVYHPAYVLRQPDLVKVVLGDLEVFVNEVKRANILETRREARPIGPQLCMYCRAPGQPHGPKRILACPFHVDVETLIEEVFPGSIVEKASARGTRAGGASAGGEEEP